MAIAFCIASLLIFMFLLFPVVNPETLNTGSSFRGMSSNIFLAFLIFYLSILTDFPAPVENPKEKNYSFSS